MRPVIDPQRVKDPQRVQLTLPKEIYLRIHVAAAQARLAPSALVTALVMEHLPTLPVQTVEK